jgi:hypothetical protein
MKIVTLWLVAMATLGSGLLPAWAGEIYVEVKTSAGTPKAGAAVQLTFDDGEKTPAVTTGKDGVALLVWTTNVKKGRILVDGVAQYAGTMPLRISFKQ